MLPQAGTLLQPRAGSPWLLAQGDAGVSWGVVSISVLPEQAQPGSAQQQDQECSFLPEHRIAGVHVASGTHSGTFSTLSGPPESFQAGRTNSKDKKRRKTFFTSIPRKVIDTHAD